MATSDRNFRRVASGGGRHHRSPRGINIVGYFFAEHGVGEMARQLAEMVRRAGIPTAEVPFVQTPGRQSAPFESARVPAEFDTNLICVNADSVEWFLRHAGTRLLEGRFNIAMWAWEVEEFPPWMASAARHFDEIWSCSTFAASAIASSVTCPVLTMLPAVTVPETPVPVRSLGSRAGLIFFFCFDYNSVFERKNPLGLIRAFERAFPPNSEHKLLIKTVNGSAFPELERRLLETASSRPNVHVVDGHLPRSEQGRLLASCDVYVSLHRSEGFGFTLAEAMALGKPVIATGYSGNLDFMDDRNSFLVPFTKVGISGGAGPYPEYGSWAEPDEEAAVHLLRRVAFERDESSTRAHRGRERVRTLLSMERCSERLAERLWDVWEARDRWLDGGRSRGIRGSLSASLVRPDGAPVLASTAPEGPCGLRSFASAEELLAARRRESCGSALAATEVAVAPPVDTAPRGAGSPPRVGLGLRVATILGSTLLGLIAVEFGLRAWDAWSTPAATLERGIVDLRELRYNDGLVPLRKPDGEYRILSFGDSFAYAAVRYPYTYHAVAGRRLSSVTANLRVRVVNLGESATSFHQYVDRHRIWSRQLEHDGVIFNVYLGNDVLDIAAGHVADREPIPPVYRDAPIHPATGILTPGSLAGGSLRLARRARIAWAMFSGGYRLPGADSPPEYLPGAGLLGTDEYFGIAVSQLDNFDPERLESLRRGYEGMREFLEAVGAIHAEGKPVAILLSPSETQVDPEVRRELARRYGIEFDRLDLGLPSYLFREAARRLTPGVPLLDLRPPFERERSTGKELYWRTNTHWSVDGNELAGRCLGDFLAERWFGQVGKSSPTCDTARSETLDPAMEAGRARALQRFLLPLVDGVHTAAGPVAAELLAGLRVRAESTSFAITTINGARFDCLGEEHVVPVSQRGLEISGWAIDSVAHAPASAVIVEIDGRDYRAEYGLSRSDVGRRYGDPTLHRVGYTLFLERADGGGEGEHSVRFKVVAAQGDSYFVSGSIPIRLVDRFARESPPSDAPSFCFGAESPELGAGS